MLILQRKIGESIMIGDNIEVKVLSYNEATGARIGIEAPKEIKVHRQEVYDRIQQHLAMAYASVLMDKKQCD